MCVRTFETLCGFILYCITEYWQSLNPLLVRSPLLLTNVHRHTKNVFSICGDCSLFAKIFLTNNFYLYVFSKIFLTKIFLCMVSYSILYIHNVFFKISIVFPYCRGLLGLSIVTTQAASPTFTHVYAALVAIVNTKFQEIGELIIKRVIINFKKGYHRNDKVNII